LRGGPAAPAAAALFFAAAVLRADSQLQIVSPANGLTLNAGGELTVTVKTPVGAFQSVSIAGDGPFTLSTGISTPPYRFSYRIPAGFASGTYRFKAVGVTASGAIVDSVPIEVIVEQSDKPTNLESEFRLLNLGEHESAALLIWGIFPDGSRVDLTRSKQIAYSSDHPAVAVVSSEGAVSGAKAGKARIAIKYADKTLVVPVVIYKGAG